MKPTVFIGSSKEGIEVARAIRTQLDEVAEITIWNEGGVFQLGHGYLEALVNALPGFDFAILVLSADDSIESRGVTSLAPRDNVMFELGLFMGRLGRERTFAIVMSRKRLNSLQTLLVYRWQDIDRDKMAILLQPLV
jgi:predicted nucleotide-binding protein